MPVIFAMTGLNRRFWFYGAGVLIVLCLFALVWMVDYLDEMELAAIPGQPVKAPEGKVTIVVKVWGRVLEVYSDGKLYKKYRIAAGKSDTPTPIGEWNVINKDYNPGGPFGSRWMGLNVPWGVYGIHGTNQPWSIGGYASKGCIRMRNRDAEELFEWVPVGTSVKIEGPKAHISRTLRYQTAGPDVVILQQKLRQLGYYEGRADGMFGRDTEVALKRFQHDKGLKINGATDRKTLDLLGM